MNTSLLQALVLWRKERAQREGVDLFRILSNRSLEEIARTLPQTKEELMQISGIKQKKYAQYGRDIIKMVQDIHIQDVSSQENVHDEEEERNGHSNVESVGEFIDRTNRILGSLESRVRGEISSIQWRKSCVYFTLKDIKEEASLSCFMWATDVSMCGVSLQEGMEIIASGFPEVYKPIGKMTFRIAVVEPVGEGALKMAYEALKKKFEIEGLFQEQRKRKLPFLPTRIGIITSRDGAVIHDFLNNIGKHGFHFEFCNSRVEGQMAVKDLIASVRTLRDRNLDVLVIMRGGGSAESLQAFNNEVLIREILKVPFPIISAIGHHQDVPLLSLVADRMVSTPTAAALTLNTSWEECKMLLVQREYQLFSLFGEKIHSLGKEIEKRHVYFRDKMDSIFERFSTIHIMINRCVLSVEKNIAQKKQFLEETKNVFFLYFRNVYSTKENMINRCVQLLEAYNPKRQLKLGYAFVKKENGSFVKSVDDIQKGDKIEIIVYDGSVNAMCISKYKEEKYEIRKK
ncbi:MAG: exodeoxyribonuclease VII large subunit [Candidatus Moranbacteria bacterium]|nr:exodeoxyribonuclease VII large subunit [Candidatus Moranbacteria bacterium]